MQLVLSIAIVATILTAFVLVSASEFRKRISTDRLATTEVLSVVSEELAAKIARLELIGSGFSGIMTLSPDLGQASFETYASILAVPEPGIINIAGIANEKIAFVFPYEMNKELIGFDYNNAPSQLEALRELERTGRPLLDGPRDLLQGVRGYILRLPVFQGTGSDRRVWGSVAIVLSEEGFIERDVLERHRADYLVAIRDGETGAPVFGDQDLFASDNPSRLIRVPGGDWEVAAMPREGWARFDVSAVNLVIVLALLALSLGMMAFVMAQRRRALMASEQLEAAVSVLADGFVLFDEEDKLVLCNDKYLEIYAASAPAIKKGAAFEEILRFGVERGQYPEADGREEQWIADRMKAHRTTSSSVIQSSADGRWLRIEEQETPSGGRVGIRVDITELVESRLRAERADDAKTQFLSVVSHELRTPMTVVLGFNKFLAHAEKLPAIRRLKAAVEGLSSSEADEALSEAMAEITRLSERVDVAGTQLMSLISDMLDLARIESKTLRIEPSLVKAPEIVSSVVEQSGPLAADKGVRFETSVEDIDVRCDETRLRQIFFNLIANAIKFTDQGIITIRGFEQNGEAVFEVSDTGTGIPASSLEKIFDRFSQADASSTRSRGGLGLGLAISKELVEVQGGRISADSVVGEGTTIRFSLPLW